jgi:hypothetical protein
MYKIFISSLCSMILATSSAFAQANNLVKIYPDDHGPLKIDMLYAIEMRCAPGPITFLLRLYQAHCPIHP